MTWLGRSVKGILLDISGVLKDGSTVIEGSVEAVKRIKAAGIPVRLVTNETQATQTKLCHQLQSFGFDITTGDIFAPAPAMLCILREQQLRPHLLVHPNLQEEFSSLDKENPNCVVIGDASEQFNYETMNRAFHCLMKMDVPKIFSLGKGRYYRESNELLMDVGPFAAALEYACDAKALVVGKPSEMFFRTALNDIGVDAKDAVMVGDDVMSDVGGAQRCGMRGILVRTGKYLPGDEQHPTVKPDAVVDNLAAAVDLVLGSQ